MTFKKRSAYIAAVVTAVALTLAGVSETYRLLPLGVLAVSLVAFVLLTAVGMIINLRSLTRAFGWLVVLAFISLPVAGLITTIQQGETGRVATSLANAIEAYRTSHGEYPNSLDQLVPEHFSSVPKTRLGLAGTTFFYDRDTNAFRLGYSLPLGMFRNYDCGTRTWTTRD